MSAMASQINSLAIVCSIFCSGADQRKHQSSESLAFLRGIHQWPLDFPTKGPVTRKMYPFDDVIMLSRKAFPYHDVSCFSCMHIWCKSTRFSWQYHTIVMSVGLPFSRIRLSTKALKLEGYCRCLRPSVCPSVRMTTIVRAITQDFFFKSSWNLAGIFGGECLGQVGSCVSQLIKYAYNWPKSDFDLFVYLFIYFCIPKSILKLEAWNLIQLDV